MLVEPVLSEAEGAPSPEQPPKKSVIARTDHQHPRAGALPNPRRELTRRSHLRNLGFGLPSTFVIRISSFGQSSSSRDATTNTPAACAPQSETHFAKAALGKAVQLGDWLKTPDPKAPMPGHFVVLRHQDGDVWDYAVISHIGTTATVEAAGTSVPADKRDLSEWHNDTFVSGPSWEEFTRAMGIDGDSAAKTAGSVYVVSVYRAAPGHRDQLDKFLGEAPRPPDTSAGNVLMQHLEGAPWTFLAIARYNSWDDFATSEKNSVAQTTKKDGGWVRLREHASFHNDTIADRLAP